MTLAGHDVTLVPAGNTGRFTLSGTNTWLVGRGPCWVVDPGPEDLAHVDAVLAEAAARGGVGGIALTHDHADHAAGVAPLRERSGAPVGAARGDVDVVLADGDRFGPLAVVAVPGHAPDHLVFLAGRVAFTGDAVLGEGSVFVAGQLSDYLAALARLRDAGLELLCPGHGPVVDDPRAKLDEYIEHRLERERRLVEALEAGVTSVDALLDRVWDDAPLALRAAAAMTLGAHLDKLEAEGRLRAAIPRGRAS